ncbi:hypothetical protein ZIOFF_005954 [Zingiber officinale]|uniref:Thylakoid lumenal protein TL20.3, chloroplastic n=1 Tax=Zingiber officinale TaxID=94328 RepID=A0A8J5I214_ZINOF|nr:hypothetical protein ZIOFF_005954 [Zingiber officinale]
MAFTSISPLSIYLLKPPSPAPPRTPPRASPIICRVSGESCASFSMVFGQTFWLSRYLRHTYPSAHSKNWRSITSTALAAVIVSFGGVALADLNKFEAELRGEFGIGSAAQFGSADLKRSVHVNENFRRANFTAADMRESNFSGSTFNGAYLEKAVAYRTNFTGN